MRVLDLFSGIGGFSLGLKRAGMKTVAFCEIDPFCRKVLRKHWPDVPIFEDVRTLKGADVGPVDVICGGYPCQPFSVAGKRLGAADDRHLWPEYFRLIQDLRPAWVIGENVAGHINMGLDAVLSDLEGAGYAARAFVIPAVAVDARHRRDRLWIVAHSDCYGSQKRKHVASFSSATPGEQHTRGTPDGISAQKNATNAECWKRSLGGASGRVGRFQQYVSWDGDWETASEPVLDRGTDGIPRRLDRLKSLGNAVVPQIPEIIGRAILNAQTP